MDREVELVLARAHVVLPAVPGAGEDAADQLAVAEMTKFSESDNWLHFRAASGLVLCCRRYLSVEKYPNYNDVLDAKGTEPFKMPLGLAEAVDKASIFTRTLDSETTDRELVNIDLLPGTLLLKGTGTIGWYKEEQKIKYKGKPLAFAINPTILRYVANAHPRASLNDQKLIVDGDNWRMVFCLFERK